MGVEMICQFSRLAIRFLYGPRFLPVACGRRASIRSAISYSDHSLSAIPAAMAGVTLSVLWMRQKL